MKVKTTIKIVTNEGTLSRKIGIGNSIVNARHVLEVAEKNIVYLALASANQFKEGDVSSWYEVKLSDFVAVEGSRSDNAKEELQNAVKSLYNRSLKMYNSDGILTEYRWIKSYRGLDSKGTVAIKFNEDLLPHLMQLRSYASIEAKNLIGVKCKYTYRVLEIISQQRSRGRNSGQVEVDLIDFMDMLEVPSTYRDFKYLNKHVIKPVVAELFKLGVVEIEVKLLKNYKTVYGLVFRYEFVG